MNKTSISALVLAIAVISGAFGAHMLKNLLTEDHLKSWHTAVEYQFYHTFALLVVGLLAQHSPQRYLQYAGYAFITGILLFSGSLYLYVLSGVTAIAIITPLGGTAFIIGWVCLAFAVKAKAD